MRQRTNTKRGQHRHRPVADGGAATDTRDRVEIDLGDTTARWRYRCPNGHTDWSRTNSHLFCYSCSRQAENGADVDPEHYELHDTLEDRTVPWSAVEIIE